MKQEGNAATAQGAKAAKEATNLKGVKAVKSKRINDDEARAVGLGVLTQLANNKNVNVRELIAKANRGVQLGKGQKFEVLDYPKVSSFNKDGIPIYYPVVCIKLTDGTEKEMSLNSLGMYRLVNKRIQTYTKRGTYTSDKDGHPFVYREGNNLISDPITVDEDIEDFELPKSPNSTVALDNGEAIQWFHKGMRYEVLGSVKYSRVATSNAPDFATKKYRGGDCYWQEGLVIKAI